jgi:hypothetical protein
MTVETLKAKLVDERQRLAARLAETEAHANALRGAAQFCDHALKLIETPEDLPEPAKDAWEPPKDA